jgi:hypothetical protein
MRVLVEFVSNYFLAILVLLGLLALVAGMKAARQGMPTGPPPTFVASIQTGHVVIERDNGIIRASLETSPFSDRLLVEPPGYLAVRFRDEGTPLENEDLLGILNWLKTHEVPFSVGKDWGPAEIMQHLWEHGRIRGRFKTIYWTGPGQWHVSDRYPGAA